MRCTPLFLSLVLFAACSKKNEEAKKTDPAAATPAPAAAKPAEPTPGSAAAPAAAPAAATGKLDCDKVLPKSLRDKYFAGATIENNPQPVDFAGSCKITQGDDTREVNVSCHDNVAAGMQASIDALKKSLPNAKEQSGIGKAAVVVDMGEVAGKKLGMQVTAWDDDSNCQVSLSLGGTVDAIAFTKDLLAALPPK